MSWMSVANLAMISVVLGIALAMLFTAEKAAHLRARYMKGAPVGPFRVGPVLLRATWTPIPIGVVMPGFPLIQRVRTRTPKAL